MAVLFCEKKVIKGPNHENNKIGPSCRMSTNILGKASTYIKVKLERNWNKTENSFDSQPANIKWLHRGERGSSWGFLTRIVTFRIWKDFPKLAKGSNSVNQRLNTQDHLNVLRPVDLTIFWL